MNHSSNLRLPLIVVALLLVMDFSLGASAFVHVPEDTDESTEIAVLSDSRLPPPLMCGGEECPEKDRLPGTPPVDSGWPVEDPGWWFGYWYDLDSNGMDDRLQRIIAGERTSVSTTSITGLDGLPTVAIVVDYSWHPGQSDIDASRQCYSITVGRKKVRGSTLSESSTP